jgi:3-oxoacyl-[acyl-carrier-protein] synthase II
MGLVTPLGTGLDNVWDQILQGKSGIAPITRFDVSRHETKIAGEVKNFNPEDYVPHKEVKKMDLFIHYALAAAQVAINNAKLDMTKEQSDRVGVVVGTGLGGLPTIEKYHQVLMERGPDRITLPTWPPDR